MDDTRYSISPKVSIIMPVYNRERTIKEAISSVLEQTFNDFELIICNDASTDNTLTAIKKIKDKRIRIVHNNKNLGPGLSRDRAINAAKGFWLTFIDADDVWAPERLETLLFAAKPLNNILVFDDMLECHDTAFGLRPYRAIRGRRAFGGSGKVAIDVPLEKFILSKRLVIQPLICLKVVKENNLRHSNRRFGEDTEFFLNLLSHDIVLRYVPKAMYQYRITPGSAMSKINRNTIMREVLEGVLVKFAHVPTVQEAMRKKIAMVRREEHYLPFVIELKKKQFYKAAKLVLGSPWIILEFFLRFLKSLTYHIHRIWHGGKTRGIR